MWWYGAHGWGGMWIFGVLWFLFVAGTLALVVWLVVRNAGPGRLARDEAIPALRDRFARGEIDEAEYRARRSVLEEGKGRR